MELRLYTARISFSFPISRISIVFTDTNRYTFLQAFSGFMCYTCVHTTPSLIKLEMIDRPWLAQRYKKLKIINAVSVIIVDRKHTPSYMQLKKNSNSLSNIYKYQAVSDRLVINAISKLRA